MYGTVVTINADMFLEQLEPTYETIGHAVNGRLGQLERDGVKPGRVTVLVLVKPPDAREDG